MIKFLKNFKMKILRINLLMSKSLFISSFASWTCFLQPPELPYCLETRFAAHGREEGGGVGFPTLGGCCQRDDEICSVLGVSGGEGGLFSARYG